MMRPRCSVLTGGFDFSVCVDFTSCPPERTAMSNSEPSAIVLQRIRCIGGLYTCFDSNGENGPVVVRSSFAARSISLDPRREFVNYCRACLAHNFILGIRASGATDCADNIALLDQWNTASRRDDSIEREQIVEMHKVDAVLKDLGWPPEGHGCSRLVLRNLNGGEHRAVHSLESNQVATGIGYCDIHLPIPLLGLCHSGSNNRLGLVE